MADYNHNAIRIIMDLLFYLPMSWIGIYYEWLYTWTVATQ